MKDDIKPSLPAPDEADTEQTPEPEDDFRTPEEIAAADHESVPANPAPKTPSTGWRQKLAPHWPPQRKEFIALAAVLLLILGGGYLLLHHPKPVVSAAKAPVVQQPPKATTVASNLTGLQVDASINKRAVTGVMIENSQDARPQSGLSDAGVVFEAIAEGGITRFLALYQDTAADNIGPIRSARPYYAQWNLGFDAGYAHVGGSPEALVNLKTWAVRDLDQFANGGSYHRISSRAAPHNVYTSIAALNQLETAKGYTTSNYIGFVRQKAAPAKQPTAKTIDLRVSGPLYNVHYDYVPATNSYNRSEAGAPHIDANNNKQLSPNVVVAMVIPYGLEADGYHSQYQVIGSGPAYVFQDGGVVIGSWTKNNEKSQIVFTDSGGKTLGLDPGQTWLTAVADSGRITYAP